MAVTLVTFVYTGYFHKGPNNNYWFFGSTIFNIAALIAIMWFGGYFSDSPGFPERRSNSVAAEIGECYGRSDSYAKRCIKMIQLKYDDCEFSTGLAIHEGRSPDLSCFPSRK